MKDSIIGSLACLVTGAAALWLYGFWPHHWLGLVGFLLCVYGACALCLTVVLALIRRDGRDA